jgi:L-seryl-tRNA(Ser) seleniumtransferase
MKQQSLANLPQIETVMQAPVLGQWCSRLSRPLVVQIAAAAVDDARSTIMEGHTAPDAAAIIEEVAAKCRTTYRRRLRKVINATGIVLHTNLGRAPLSPETWNAATAVNTGYSNLEMSLETGKRQRRSGILPDLLSLLVGCEASLLVNNCASALFLMLSALASGKEVVVSRGEQIQIGGGFRIPDMLRLSGARLVEVGTTNITTVADYTNALTEETAMVLFVHASNFRIDGFTRKPSTAEISAALPPQVIFAVDQGSGTTREAISGETRVRRYLRDGSDLVCFSGDKVLGGPQAGIVVGRQDLLDTMARHPLMRILRSGKTIRSLMEEHLINKLNGGPAGQVDLALSLSLPDIKRRGQSIRRRTGPARARLVPSSFAVGGGSAPGQEFPSFSLELVSEAKPELLLARLRDWDPPIIGTISGGHVLLNVATIGPSELRAVGAALKTILGGG